MDVVDVLRRLILGHGRLILICVVAPALVVAAVLALSPRQFEASARIQATSKAPQSEVESNAVLDRVEGMATSPEVIEQALQEVGGAGLVWPVVGVSRLGSAPVVDITVTDRDPARATVTATALARRVVDLLNSAGNERTGGLERDLAAQQSQLLDQRRQLALRLASSPSSSEVAQLSAELGSVDQELGQVASALREAQVSSATDSSAALLSTPGPATPVPSRAAVDLSLALVLGAVAGVLLAGLWEMVRPATPDGRAFARDASLPWLGRLRPAGASDAGARPDPTTPDDTVPGSPDGVALEIGRTLEASGVASLRRAAATAGVDTILLAGPSGAGDLGAVAAALDTQLRREWRSADTASTPVDLPPNGHTAARHGVATDVLTATRPRTSTAPRVRALTAVTDDRPPGSAGIALVVPPWAPRRELDDLTTVSVTAGWPLLGVLGLPGTDRRPPWWTRRRWTRREPGETR